MRKSFIPYTNPPTKELTTRLACAPANPPNGLEDLIEQALQEVRKRYRFLTKISFRLFYLDEKVMTYRLSTLARSFLGTNPESTNDEILLYLLGDGKRRPPHYLLSTKEERDLIRAYQENIPGSTELTLLFFAPKIIRAVKPLRFGINKDNREDIQAVCLGTLNRLMVSLDLSTNTIGLSPNLVSLTISNDLLEEFGQGYTVTLHRSQLNHLRRLHCMMQDEDFAALSQVERAKIAKVPFEIVAIYDSHNSHSANSDKNYHTTSTHMDILETYSNSSVYTAAPYLALKMAEDRYDLDLASEDETFSNLTDIARHWLERHNQRPSVAGKKMKKDFSKARKRLKMTEEEFARYMDEINTWLCVYADDILS